MLFGFLFPLVAMLNPGASTGLMALFLFYCLYRSRNILNGFFFRDQPSL